MSRPGALPAPSGAPGGPNPLSHFVKLRKLGEGGFGKVFLVRDERDGQSYVMKEIDVSKLDARGRKEALKECAFLARMHHPNIIGYKEFFEVAGPPQSHAAGPWNLAAWGGRAPAAAGAGRPGSASTLYIVMSYADGGDLEARIKAQQKLSGSSGRIVPFPEQQIIDWFIQTALAIKHIHDRKILHRSDAEQTARMAVDYASQWMCIARSSLIFCLVRVPGCVAGRQRYQNAKYFPH
jgi:NIMA (never in mitosis gene a)-related kinase